jgi:hypothetical protein
MEVQLHSFLISALDGGEWLTSHPRRFTPKKKTRYSLSRRLGEPHDGLKVFEKRKIS